MHHPLYWTRSVLILSATALGLLTGCFSERAFPMRCQDLVRVQVEPAVSTKEVDTRQWLAATHAQLAHLLPAGKPKALLTADLENTACPTVNVYKHFDRNEKTLESLFGNFWGLQMTAQVSGSNFDPAASTQAWSGYKQVWIPINPQLSLCGQFRLACRDGHLIDADCIVLLPGILGHNSIARTQCLAEALLSAGFHVLAVELRGHGQTEMHYPNVPYTFGPLEVGDLLVVSEWLTAQRHVQRTGLIGFCWGANQAMLAAWMDGQRGPHEGISPTLAPHMRPPTEARHYEAGVIAFSPVLRVEELIDKIDQPRSKFQTPILAALQDVVRNRSKNKGYPHTNGSLRQLILDEYERCEMNYPEALGDALRFVRYLPYKGQSGGDKLSAIRVPVLIVQAANDPLAYAQDVATFMSGVKNPNVAALILPGGGHIGFAPYARSYYYSLIINFFNRTPSVNVVQKIDSES